VVDPPTTVVVLVAQVSCEVVFAVALGKVVLLVMVAVAID
jgi:hypothetical protein